MISALALGLSGWLIAAPPTASPALLAQDEATEEQPAPAPVVDLGLGERFGVDGWELEIQDVFMEASPRRYGYDELRVSVAFRTIGGPLPYLFDAFAGTSGYPALQLRDAAGEIWDIPVERPASNLFPGSTQHTVEPGIPAHWTVGFDVPQSASDIMSVEAVWNGNVVAGWDLTSVPSQPRGWDTPPGATNALVGDTIEWNDALDVTPLAHSLAACGDPDSERVTTVYLLIMEVENLTDRDALFPDVRYPEVPGAVVWDDGSSARYADLWAFAPTEEELPPYNARNSEQWIIPPRTSADLAFVYAVPRDSRLVDPDQPPASVLMVNPAGQSYWFDVEAEGLVELENDLCIELNATGSVTFSIGLPEGFVPAPPGATEGEV
jgi:hypothetical protein